MNGKVVDWCQFYVNRKVELASITTSSIVDTYFKGIFLRFYQMISLYFHLLISILICGTYASFLYAKWDNYRHNIHHTCANNEECDENFGLIWPSYKFICCTTIVCDENYGDYYFVHSGCATQQQSRLERKIFDLLIPSIEKGCFATRENFLSQNFNNAIVITEQSVPSTTTTLPLRIVSPANCSCPIELECCIHIECSDNLQIDTRNYDVKSECSSKCLTIVNRIGQQYSFYLPKDIWQKRVEYEREESAPPVEKSCRETR
ncbi:unnamed protein product [Dracunculus medinensis]|uniref:Uncharacterized protein n=1 Tax=Dracunculus medinensis TaxID=318479 RepID=A0A0N4U9X3_DRAME|nr:unnamed protein product [Dracunculus medinensis]